LRQVEATTSEDGSTFVSQGLFTGNRDRNTVAQRFFATTVTARYVRLVFIAGKFNQYFSVRWDVLLDPVKVYSTNSFLMYRVVPGYWNEDYDFFSRNWGTFLNTYVACVNILR
jgi:hypothetical protein